MGRPYQNLTFCTRLWHGFCYACAPVEIVSRGTLTPQHEIKCFTWNKVKRII